MNLPPMGIGIPMKPNPFPPKPEPKPTPFPPKPEPKPTPFPPKPPGILPL